MVKNKWTKISSVLFLVTALSPVFFTLFFLGRQQWIRHEMKERLEHENMQTVALPESAVQWVRFGKEIRIQGKMFDIKSYTVTAGVFIFTGLYDDEETALNDQLEKSTEHRGATASEVLSSLFNMLHSVYRHEHVESKMPDGNPKYYSLLVIQQLPTPLISVLTHPPQA